MDINFDSIQIGSDSEYDYFKIANDCYVDLSKDLAPPEILLSIGQHWHKGQQYDTSIMTAGEFSAIVGTSKTKKSFLKSAFIGCYIGGDANIHFPNIKAHRDKDYTILDFDTEQGKYYTHRSFNRTVEITGVNYKNYRGYCTRHLSSSERLGLIDYCLKNQKELYETPVKFMSIDGIADLVENTNDIVMSKEASDYILKWTHDYNMHITTIIHKSGSTNKPLGHLGTYVLKKAETVIDLELDKDGTIKVTNPYSRGYKFEEFSFDVNKDSLPNLIENTF